MNWFYADHADQQHEVSEEDLSARVEDGTITRTTLVWNESMDNWKPCGEALPELFSVTPETRDSPASEAATLPEPPPLSKSERSLARANEPEAMPGPPPLDGMALCSMIFGILGIITCVPILSIPAVICGHIGLKKSNLNPGNPSNRGFSITGIITGYIGLCFLVLILLYFIFIVTLGVSGGFEEFSDL